MPITRKQARMSLIQETRNQPKKKRNRKRIYTQYQAEQEEETTQDQGAGKQARRLTPLKIPSDYIAIILSYMEEIEAITIILECHEYRAMFLGGHFNRTWTLTELLYWVNTKKNKLVKCVIENQFYDPMFVSIASLLKSATINKNQHLFNYLLDEQKKELSIVEIGKVSETACNLGCNNQFLMLDKHLTSENVIAKFKTCIKTKNFQLSSYIMTRECFWEKFNREEEEKIYLINYLLAQYANSTKVKEEQNISNTNSLKEIITRVLDELPNDDETKRILIKAIKKITRHTSHSASPEFYGALEFLIDNEKVCKDGLVLKLASSDNPCSLGGMICHLIENYAFDEEIITQVIQGIFNKAGNPLVLVKIQEMGDLTWEKVIELLVKYPCHVFEHFISCVHANLIVSMPEDQKEILMRKLLEFKEEEEDGGSDRIEKMKMVLDHGEIDLSHNNKSLLWKLLSLGSTLSKYKITKKALRNSTFDPNFDQNVLLRAFLKERNLRSVKAIFKNPNFKFDTLDESILETAALYDDEFALAFFKCDKSRRPRKVQVIYDTIQKEGETPKEEELVKLVSNVTSSFFLGKILEWACGENYNTLCKAILDNNSLAFSKEHKNDILEKVCMNNNTEMFHVLAGKWAIQELDLVACTRFACKNGNLEIVKYLFPLGDAEKIHAFLIKTACNHEHYEIAKFLVNQEDAISRVEYFIEVLCTTEWYDLIGLVFKGLNNYFIFMNMLGRIIEKGSLKLLVYVLRNCVFDNLDADAVFDAVSKSSQNPDIAKIFEIVLAEPKIVYTRNNLNVVLTKAVHGNCLPLVKMILNIIPNFDGDSLVIGILVTWENDHSVMMRLLLENTVLKQSTVDFAIKTLRKKGKHELVNCLVAKQTQDFLACAFADDL